MLAKRDIHPIAEIEFENCICFSIASEVAFPLRHPFFLISGQRFIIIWANASKQERWEERT